MHSVRLSLLIISMCALVSSGCDSSKSGDSKPATQTDKPTTKPTDKPDTDQPPASTRPTMAEADVKAFVDAWLTSQNDGKFDAYEAMYAKRFEGVRRSGPKVVRLDRKGWVKERKRMFKRKMVVEVSKTDIDAFSQSAVVTFVQTWASGKYKDVGPKQLVVVREGDALRIAREEMLASTLLGDSKKTRLADDKLVFVIEVAGTSYAVLDHLGKAKARKLKLLDDGDPVVVSGQVNVQKLPVSVSGWQGQTLQNGTCTAKIESVLALSQIIPHFGEKQTWSGEMDDSEPYTQSEIARAAFHDSTAYLVGKLAPVGDACKLGSNAHVASTPAPAVGKSVTVTDKLRTSAVSAFRALPAYKRVQKEFMYDNTGAWDEYTDEGMPPGAPVVHIHEHPKSGAVQVVVQARAGAGCGMFEGQLTALFALEGSLAAPKFKLLHAAENYPEIVAVLDATGDGELEYLAKVFVDTVLLSTKGEEQRRVGVPFFDCGC